MELTILGCNGPFPAPGGATSGYLVTAGDTAIQLDLGCGTLAALTGLMPPEGLTALVFSHWHYDHCSDVLPLLYRLQAVGAVLDVYGPEDASSAVRGILAGEPAVRLHTIAPGEALTLGTVTLKVSEARHPVPAVMLRLEAEGKTLCYTGDTNTVPGLDEFAKEADLLLADGLFPEAAYGEQKPHLSAKMTAELAARAGARRLVVTHLNPAIDPHTLLAEARTAFLRAELAVRGARYTL